MNIITAHENTPLFHQWVTEAVGELSLDSPYYSPLKVRMQIRTKENGDFIMAFKRGLSVGIYSHTGTLAVGFHLYRPGSLGIGDHNYVISAVDTNNKSVLSEAGIIRVLPGGEAPAGLPEEPNAVFMGIPGEDLAPDEDIEWRMRTCEECPFYAANDGICTDCGCYMPYKTRLKDATCPQGRWVV